MFSYAKLHERLSAAVGQVGQCCRAGRDRRLLCFLKFQVSLTRYWYGIGMYRSYTFKVLNSIQFEI
jgi:hypothetical protein